MNIIDVNKRRRYLSSDKYSSKPSRFVLEGVKFSNNTTWDRRYIKFLEISKYKWGICFFRSYGNY